MFELQHVRPRAFGWIPPAGLVAVGGLLLVAAIAFFASGHWVAAPVLLVLALALLGLYAVAARHRPPSRPARLAVGAVWHARDELRLAGASAGAWTRAGWRAICLERELRRLRRDRDEAQHALGGAAYRGDEAGTAASRKRMEELDERMAACSRAMGEARFGAEARVSRARAPLRKTEVLKANAPTASGARRSSSRNR